VYSTTKLRTWNICKTQDTRRKTELWNLSLESWVLGLIFCIFLCFATGCGSAWRGRIAHLEDGKIIIQPEGDGKIKSGSKILIYRQRDLTHPVTGEVLGTIKDDIARIPVLRVRDRSITATADEQEFSIMMVGDQVVSARGSVKSPAGSVYEVGKIRTLNTQKTSVEIAVTSEEMVAPGDILTAIKYTSTVAGIVSPDAESILAVAAEPVAHMRVTAVSALDADGKPALVQASYELVDKKLGWIEVDDTVVKLTGDMLSERLWFQDPPVEFSEDQIFGRSYLHALRHYDAGRYREAILDFNDVIQVNPEYKDASYLLGLCYANLNRHEEAAAHFKELAELRSDDAKIWTALAYSYLKQEKLQEAVEAYEKLAYLLPGNPDVWADTGDIYRKLGEYQKAEQAYKKALEIDGNNKEAKYELQVGQTITGEEQ